MRRTWDLKNPEEAYDAIPEIWEGKNIADFVDPDIMAKLDALEKEEEEREKNGFYKLDGLNYDSGKILNIGHQGGLSIVGT